MVLGASATRTAGLALFFVGLAVEGGSSATTGVELQPIVVGDAGLGRAGRF